MNVSVTDYLASYVRRKVRSGRYNNASEVVREALRRTEDEEGRVLRLAKPAAEDVLADLDSEQLEAMRRRAQAGILSMERGDYAEYEGRAGLKKLAEEVKARGRRRLARAIAED